MRLHPKSWKPVAVIGLAASAVLVEMVGCSELLGVQSDRHLVVDSGPSSGDDAMVADVVTEQAARDAGPWDCLSVPPNLSTMGTQIDLTVLVMDALKPSVRAEDVDGGSGLDILSATVLPGVQVQACPDALDPTCAHTGSAVQTTDDAGTTPFHVTGDFNGWFIVNRPDLLPYRFYPGPIPGGPTSVLFPLAVVSQMGAQEIIAALGANAGESFDAGSRLGLIFVSVYDCNDHFAEGVSFSISNPGTDNILFYTAGGFPSTMAKATDKLGAGGFINVPAGPQTVRATNSQGTPLTPVQILVYPATVSQIFFRAKTTH